MKRGAIKSGTGAAPLAVRYPVADHDPEAFIGEWPLVRGQVVRRPAFDSPTLGVTVPTRVGIVVDIYRRAPGALILVDFRGDAKSDCGGLFTTTLERLAHSNARVETEWIRD